MSGIFPSNKASDAELSCYPALDELLNKKSCCQWFQTPWRAYRVIVIPERHKIIRPISNHNKTHHIMQVMCMIHVLGMAQLLEHVNTWWRQQLETFSALLALCEGNHRSPVVSSHKGQSRGGLMFNFICAWTNGWANNRDAGDSKRHRVHYDVTVMEYFLSASVISDLWHFLLIFHL